MLRSRACAFVVCDVLFFACFAFVLVFYCGVWLYLWVLGRLVFGGFALLGALGFGDLCCFWLLVSFGLVWGGVMFVFLGVGFCGWLLLCLVCFGFCVLGR